MSKTKNIKKTHQKLKKELASKERHVSQDSSFQSIAWRSSVDMLAGIIIGTGGGILFDRYFETPCWGLIIGFFLGSAAGLLNVYRGLCKVGYGFNRK
jgi:F0F1-type ATP synthase assembly protein I